jgi:anthranilate synthase component I
LIELQLPPAALRRLAARFPERYPVLFDSAADGPLSQHSILVVEPRAALWLDRDGTLHSSGVRHEGAGFLAALENWWLAERIPHRVPAAAGRLPFQGGWAVFLSYEIAQEIEPRLQLPPSVLPWKAFALRAAVAVIQDRQSGRAWLSAEESDGTILQRVQADIAALHETGEEDTAAADQADAAAFGRLAVREIVEENPDGYLGRVARAKEYVRAGDIYQANLSRPWHVDFAAPPPLELLYRRLCATNPAPFAAFVQWGGVSILSSSPERLLRIAGRRIDTRPIAGTRPRSRRPGDDLAEMRELAAHPKERAEHIMLIDLERNDLGRVCEAGSVHVDELMTIESYAHVHHIVSNVTGELRAEVTPIAAVRALFPGGTITGCPKFRCMQIIAELEGEGRGAYTGSLGFLGRDGTMDMNILIRTMTVIGERAVVRAGGGIVADSDPLRELEETRAKARGLLRVFGEPGVAV